MLDVEKCRYTLCAEKYIIATGKNKYYIKYPGRVY